MSSNYKIKTDLKEAEAMADSLAEYVRGDELYGNAGGGFFSAMPGLTVGALLMRLRRLNALSNSLNGSQQSKLDTIVQRWEKSRDDWRLHYEQKILREIESRLDSMKTFFRECADSQQSCHNNYRPELLKRTIVEELLHEMNELNISNDDVRSKVDATDGQLRSYLRADEFQWSDELQSVYPENEYWWLYQKPPKALHEE